MKAKIYYTVFLASVLGALTLSAREPDWANLKKPVHNYKLAGCSPAFATARLSFNNINARIENGGNMWQNRSNNTADYEAPKGEGVSPLFAGALWMGGKSPNGQLKLAAVTFRAGNDFWPGPLSMGTASTTEEVCNEYNKFFKAFKPDVINHVAYLAALEKETADIEFPGYSHPRYFDEWPGNGGPGQDPQLAPYVDYNQNGQYDADGNDYPDYGLLQGPLDCRKQKKNVPLFGDTTVYWIFNDKGNIHTETNAEPIGMEIRAQAFAFADKSAINNMTFYNYVLINQGTQTLTDTYFGQWADADLGNSNDDFVGCDVSRGLGYCYNGDNTDEQGPNSKGYGETPPAIGIDFFQGPFQDDDKLDNIGPYDKILAPFGSPTPISYNEATEGKGIPYLGLGIGYGDSIVDNERFGMRKFIYYNIGGSPINGDPSTAQNYYNYLTGYWKNNQRFVYGGNAVEGTEGNSAFCDFMFPGDTDPLNFGTLGAQYGSWDEVSSQNDPSDRRFMQSSGPFTLTPGQVNNITVGVVFARAAKGQDAVASVTELKEADDLAQGLFDNCFQLFEGPDAPDVNVTELDGELILSLTNPSTSNNKNEGYDKIRAEIPYEYTDRTYNFEGYLIYQLKSATVSVAELTDDTKAKLIMQCDVRNYDSLSNPISILYNYIFLPEIRKAQPQIMVKPANNRPLNSGIIRTISVKEDKFASGSNKGLINNKPYYFIAVAYGYNNFLEYNPILLKGQSEQFVSSRKNGRGGSITPSSGIPHILDPQYGGTIVNSSFGDGITVTRLEGTGNGNNFLDITQETEDRIFENTVDWTSSVIDYKPGAGPVEVKVYDPLKVTADEFTLKVLPDATHSTKSSKWILTNVTKDKTYTSDNTIDVGGEQLIVDAGITVNVSQHFYYKEGNTLKTDFVGAALEFENPLFTWLSGISDVESILAEDNWILAGEVDDSIPDYTTVADKNESYEKILGGTWSPYGLVAGGKYGPAPINSGEAFVNSSIANAISQTTSVDVVLTPDKSKWTRCVVLEMQADTNLARGIRKGRMKRQPSVDKNGQNMFNGGNVTDCSLISDTGMSWFPGYAICVETGERLNMAFGEDSWLTGENGNDMIWNPTSTLRKYISGAEAEYLAGGKHFIYVYKNTWAENKVTTNSTETIKNRYMPTYDYGKMVYSAMNSDTTSRIGYVWRSANWVGLPLLAPGYSLKTMKDGLVPSAARIKLRVNKEYQPYAVGYDKTLADSNKVDTIINNGDTTFIKPFNQYFPFYKFSTKGYEPSFGVSSVAKSALDIIRAVPNPYYAYSNYESGRLDNRIKITNLPKRCIVSIYTLDGTLIRQFNKDADGTSIEWDLKNFANIPIASGTYVIHINAPGVGEKVIKWFGVTRPADLHSL